jgi:hypothetical protein
MDIQTLIDKAGGRAEFQALTRVARTTVLDWERAGRIPAGRVLQIATALSLPVDEVIMLATTPRLRGGAA